MNTTVVSNATTTGTGGDGFFVDFNDQPGLFVTVTNSIFWGNTPADFGVINDANSTYTVTYSDIGSGFVPGPGNISADPLFSDTVGGDYHLTCSSPCVDTGTNIGAPDTDFEGDARPYDGDRDGTDEWDMGADELDIPCISEIYLPIILKNYQ